MSAAAQETISYGFSVSGGAPKSGERELRAPKLTQEEAEFLLARGPFVARLAAQEKLLQYLYSITPKAGELGPTLPEYVEQELLESIALAKDALARFDEDRNLAEVISISPEAELQDRQAVDRTAGSVALRETVKVTGELSLLNSAEKKYDWRIAALCAQTDQEAFFPEKGGSTREAKKVCLTCEVREECLEYALGNDERHGIWGGLSERERRKLKKRVV